MKTGLLHVLLAVLAVPHWAVADTLLFSDDFEDAGTFGANWTHGAYCEADTIALAGGWVRATANCNYIETVREFDGDFRVEIDVEKLGLRSYSCWDFAVQFGTAIGSICFDQAGFGAFDGVAIGSTPIWGACGDDVLTDGAGVNRGTAILAYRGGSIEFTFVNGEGVTLEVAPVHVGALGPAPIRIHLAGWADAPRAVDNVRVYSLAPAPPPTAHVDHAVEIWWQSVAGTTYQVQWTPALGPTNWQSLGGPVVGSGGIASVFDSTRTGDTRFYRIEVVP